ncbi:MAG: metal-dependent transcriptional regulator [Oscillospiraceae bacterium]|nr:metal-dependent transcriptional regulator [Oscillospiraceae bacterium]
MQVHAGESREDYLETILIIQQQRGAVRSVEIAEYLNYSAPSVSRAMSLLREAQLITMDKSGLIQLTQTGCALAEQIYERHRLLTRFLMNLGVSRETAEQDACRMEHVISAESFEKMKEHAGIC